MAKKGTNNQPKVKANPQFTEVSEVSLEKKGKPVFLNPSSKNIAVYALVFSDDKEKGIQAYQKFLDEEMHRAKAASSKPIRAILNEAIEAPAIEEADEEEIVEEELPEEEEVSEEIIEEPVAVSVAPVEESNDASDQLSSLGLDITRFSDDILGQFTSIIKVENVEYAKEHDLTEILYNEPIFLAQEDFIDKMELFLNNEGEKLKSAEDLISNSSILATMTYEEIKQALEDISSNGGLAKSDIAISLLGDNYHNFLNNLSFLNNKNITLTEQDRKYFFASLLVDPAIIESNWNKIEAAGKTIVKENNRYDIKVLAFDEEELSSFLNSSEAGGVAA